jgi:uncharacterized protein (DUF433 family)
MARVVRGEREQIDALIEQYVEPHPNRPGRAEWRLKGYGLPVWVLIAVLRPDGSNIDRVAENYDIPREAIEAARAYHALNRAIIDDRIEANRDA